MDLMILMLVLAYSSEKLWKDNKVLLICGYMVATVEVVAGLLKIILKAIV